MRKFLLGLFAVMMSISLVACGAEKTNEEVKDAEETEETKEEVESEVVFDGDKVVVDGVEVQLGGKMVGSDIVIYEKAKLESGKEVLSEVKYIYNGEDLQDVTVVMHCPDKEVVKEMQDEIATVGGSEADLESVKVNGNDVSYKLKASSVEEMKAVPKAMLAEMFVK